MIVEVLSRRVVYLIDISNINTYHMYKYHLFIIVQEIQFRNGVSNEMLIIEYKPEKVSQQEYNVL